ncbi:glycosyltransferase [Mesobacillus foraminis]|uniref:Glycosyltransferase involved in cell wall biosynthesis n=1 Tax=Mesobacillus foraminis TaxID=279826 RepID=A0A4R2BIG3_9BACI|nr:glycosyltransferase family 2 protein [Mesobacillus foraminis]TCN26232.1 glycosyltransferase involved in cell wall biosynthesis [Mesobacillus foraminis]
MVSVSLCMIVRNEEEVLERCLQSVCELVDEIVIVDTGSEDETVNIARNYTDKVYFFEWCDDFSKARNYAFSKATKEYIFFMDADDLLPESEQLKFKHLKETLDPSVDIVSMYTTMAFDPQGNPAFQYRRNRFVKRSRGYKWIGPVHEYLEVYGKTVYSDIGVSHIGSVKSEFAVKSTRNLDIYQKRLERGEIFTPRDLFYYANELREHQKYEESISQYESFLVCEDGWIEDQIKAYEYMSFCYGQLGKQEERLRSLLSCLEITEPRPKTACMIGDCLLEKGKLQAAAFWFKTATEFKRYIEDPSFYEPAYHTWYPHLQLVVCQWGLGNIEESVRHNDLAAQSLPNDPKVLYNKEFFNTLKEKSE